jgi:hypothetical protein
MCLQTFKIVLYFVRVRGIDLSKYSSSSKVCKHIRSLGLTLVCTIPSQFLRFKPTAHPRSDEEISQILGQKLFSCGVYEVLKKRCRTQILLFGLVFIDF